MNPYSVVLKLLSVDNGEVLSAQFRSTLKFGKQTSISPTFLLAILVEVKKTFLIVIHKVIFALCCFLDFVFAAVRLEFNLLAKTKDVLIYKD